MDAYNGEQEEEEFSSSKDADLSNRLKDIPQDRLVEEIIHAPILAYPTKPNFDFNGFLDNYFNIINVALC